MTVHVIMELMVIRFVKNQGGVVTINNVRAFAHEPPHHAFEIIGGGWRKAGETIYLFLLPPKGSFCHFSLGYIRFMFDRYD